MMETRTVSTTTNNRNEGSNSGSMIRHSGKALIRGKIRRVWRPRYLEVCDNGMVHYYEVHNSNTNNNNVDNEESAALPKTLKCTLQVFFARIIDVTTLRDVHVGLPMGSFGFLFCGQRLHYCHDAFVSSSLLTSPSSAVTNTPSALSSSMECMHPMPGGDFGGGGSGGGMQAPRDFLCAVGTLEEAQSWVVALQWAAAERKLKDDWQDDEDFHVTSSTTAHDNAFQVIHNHHLANNSAISSNANAIGSAGSYRTKGYSRKREKQSKTVVTKVQSLRLVRTNTWQFEWAFAIHMLVLRSSSTSASAGNNTGNTTTMPTSSSSKVVSVQVEERILLRTLHDIQTMLDDLEKEVTNPKSCQVLAQLKASSSSSSSSILLLLTTTNDGKNATIMKYANLVEAIPHVDRILRALAMDPHICNSQSMRSFWSLATATTTTTTASSSAATAVESSRNSSCSSTTSADWKQSSMLSSLSLLLQIHDPKRVVDQRQIESPQNTKQFVQEWLQTSNTATAGTDATSSPSMTTLSNVQVRAMSFAVWLLQRPAVVVGILAFLILLLPPMLRLYEQCIESTTVRLRLDVLLASWIASGLLGRELQRQEASHRRQESSARQQAASHPSADSLLLEEDESSLSIVDVHSITSEEEAELEEEAHDDDQSKPSGALSSPLPEHPANGGLSCWSRPQNDIFRVRGATYLKDRIKIPSAAPPFDCRGVDIWLTDNPERHIARHPRVLGGRLGERDTFVVNFLLPFGNFVAYFGIPPIGQFPQKLANVWTNFLEGDQQYRDARLKLLPVVVDGPWIVRAAVGPGTSPALLGKVIPLQYYFSSPSTEKNGVYEVDVIITASRIAKGILNVVSGQSKLLTMAFAFIIEAAEEEELPETVLCTFQMHSIHLEDCPPLPECNLDEIEST